MAMDPSSSSSSWFYRNFLGEEKGPYSAEEMLSWYKDGHFTSELMVRRATQTKFFRLASPQCFTQPVQVVDLDTEEPGSSLKIKKEDTQIREDYVDSLLKKKNKVNTSQEYPVQHGHKKAKIENEKSNSPSLGYKRSNKNTKSELEDENIDKEIKTNKYSLKKSLKLRGELKPAEDFSKEIEEYNKKKQNMSCWKFEKVCSKCGRGPPEYYVMCTACPLALKDQRIRQMVKISEFPRHVNKAHGDHGLNKMYSGFFPGCNICGASNVTVNNIENHKKCIDQL